MKKKIQGSFTCFEPEVELSLSFSLLNFEGDGESDEFGNRRVQTEWSNGANSILPIDGWIDDGRENAIRAVNAFFDYVDQQRKNVK